MLIASSLCLVAVVFLFPGDLKRAERAEEAAEKRTCQLEKTRLRSESMMDSRASTFYNKDAVDNNEN